MGGAGPAWDELIGRDHELRTLHAIATRALEGRGAVGLVAGPAGVGKTRLLMALAETLSGGGAAVGWGRAWDGEGAPAYWPWSQALRSLVRGPIDVGDDRPGGAEARAYLARAMPALASTSAIVPDAVQGAASAGARFLVFDAAVEALATAARAQPVVVLLDDLHATDVASVQLLEFLAAEVRRLPVAVVAAYRDHHLLAVPSTLDEQGGPTIETLRRLPTAVHLEGLSDAAVADLLERRCGTAPPAALVERVQRITGGNPFFVGEIAGSLAGSGGWHEGGAVPLPASLRTLVRARVMEMDPAAQAVLATASVLGEEFAVGPLTLAVGDRAATLAALDAAVATGLVRETGPFGTYRFVHALTRESLYADLGTVRRSEAHREVGRALELVYAGRASEHADELAQHFARAAALGDPRPAVTYARIAAERAEAVYAYDDAARSYRMALDAVDLAVGDAAERAELLLAMAEAQTRGTGCDVAVGTFDEAARLASAAARADLLGRAAVGATRAHFRLAGYVLDLDVRLRVLEQAAAATKGRRDALEAMVLAALAWTRSVSSSEADALDLAEQACALADATGDADAIALARHARRWALEGPGELTEKRAATGRIIELAGDHDLELAWWGHRWALYDALEACDPNGVADELARVARLADRLREPYFATFVALFRSAVALLEGRFDAAAADAEQATQLAAISRVGPEHIAGLELFLHRERGSLDMAAIAPFLDAFPDVPVFQALAAWGHANTGDLDAARLALRRLEGGIGRLPKLGHRLATLALAAEAAYLAGDAAVGRAAAPLLAEAGDRGVVIGGPLLWTGSAAHYAGLAYAVAGDPVEAVESLRAGRAAHERIGASSLLAASEAALAAVTPRPDPRNVELVPSLQFARAGDGWQIGPAEGPVHVRHSLGMQYLQVLLASPGRAHLALDLATGPAGAASAGPVEAELAAGTLHRWRGTAADVVIDDTARAAYRKRYEELSVELAEADDWHDGERATGLREELDALGREIARGVGLGGRSRPLGSDAERARVNVTRAIRSAIARIAEHDATLGDLLSTTITTGTYCQYDPPSGAAAWVLS